MMKHKIAAFSELSDAELLAAIRLQTTSSSEAFSELYDRYSARISSYCIALLGTEDGNDAFQEVFIRFYKLAERSAIENVPAMLITIARNACIDAKRRRKTLIPIDDDGAIHLAVQHFSSSATMYEHQAYEHQELMRLVEIGLEYLDFDVREAFVLRHYQGMSYQEIASITNVPETTITKRIWRAKERLKQVLSPFITDLNQF